MAACPKCNGSGILECHRCKGTGKAAQQDSDVAVNLTTGADASSER
jgi:DnaJ-class molecular chaperone